MMVFLKRARLRWSPAFWQQAQSRLDRFFIQMSEYLVDHHRIFNAGDYFDRAAAFAANTSLLEGLLLAAVSTGRCNTLNKSFRWCLEV
jgi:hypothetical protein